MKTLEKFEYPPELLPVFKKAKKLEWITIGYLLITACLVFFTMGSSQAMKTAWFEDVLSLTPSISFLIASRLVQKEPNKEFPYGYHKVASIAYLVSAVALFVVGGFLMVDSAMTLIKQEHPTIGIVVIFGREIWLGYLMMVVMFWGTFPSYILGKMKLPLAKQLHEKNLYTDAEMNKADWMTAAAAIGGIWGIGMGWWWADATAALIISLDILKDGFTNLKQAVYDLIDQTPKKVDDQEDDPLLKDVRNVLHKQPWVEDFSFRMREEGHIYLGEGFVKAHHTEVENLPLRIQQLKKEVEDLSWRIHEFVITPVITLPDEHSEK
ncbi:hypothetical protein TH61_00350 [Rufibacter sp. DG15C]|uniref:cation diffusion facilitator family transporter n=1 Tax=Rufibacter sp. DG15C TaxID=1379909 RepID=UPI00078D8C60|nr:cation diffusion facilitator family transporter [Rufibacter sp. DG15C]AMM49934.1 hypothetical protein TH61_00350 [Rufibacter sp. DG15C]